MSACVLFGREYVELPGFRNHVAKNLRRRISIANALYPRRLLSPNRRQRGSAPSLSLSVIVGSLSSKEKALVQTRASFIFIRWNERLILLFFLHFGKLGLFEAFLTKDLFNAFFFGHLLSTAFAVVAAEANLGSADFNGSGCI